MPRYPSSSVFYRDLRRDYPRIVRGSGAWLHDDRGREYLDASGGALVANVGHGVAEIAEALTAQASRVAYATSAYFTNDAVEDLALCLAKVLPEPFRHFYFLCSGSEAIEASIKLARQYWVEKGRPSKWKILSRTPSYHGNTLTALSVSGREHYRKIFGPLLTEFPRVPAPDPYRHPGCIDCTGESVIREIERQGPDTIAAFLAEPIIGSSLGATVLRPGYYEAVQWACQKYDLLYIADEVMAGMGRTGRWFSFEHYCLMPDIIAAGKGLSGGYAPLSAVIASRNIVDTIAKGSGGFVHAQTYSHTPVISAAGAATLRYLMANRLVERCASMETEFFNKLATLKHHPNVGDVRGKGLMAGIELVKDKETKEPLPRAEYCIERLTNAALENGLIFWSNAGHLANGDGDIVMLGPPFTISPAEIDQIVERLAASLERVFGK